MFSGTLVPRDDLLAGFKYSEYSPPSVDRIWLWVYCNKIPIYPIFYLLKRDYKCSGYMFRS